MAHVIVVATRYDGQTRVTHRWAQDIVRNLANHGHQVTFLSAQQVTAVALSQALHPPASYVLFYGHGESGRLIGQKGRLFSGSDPTLVEEANVRIFRGLSVYAVCCQVLRGLGTAYAAAFPQGALIGYEHPFGFSNRNAVYFQEEVNSAAVNLVNHMPPQQVVNQLRNGWRSLADEFFNGPLQNRPDAFLAAYAASANAVFVGLKP